MYTISHPMRNDQPRVEPKQKVYHDFARGVAAEIVAEREKNKRLPHKTACLVLRRDATQYIWIGLAEGPALEGNYKALVGGEFRYATAAEETAFKAAEEAAKKAEEERIVRADQARLAGFGAAAAQAYANMQTASTKK